MSSIALAQPRGDRTMRWAVIVSVVIHAIVIMPYIKNLVPDEFFKMEEAPVVVPPLEFELVSPPERPIPSDEVSKYLSTVSSKASDVVDKPVESDVPHSTGVVPFVDTPSPQEGIEGGGGSELPPLPDQETDLGEAFERSRFTSPSSPSREQSRPEQNPAYDSEGSVRASFGGISINTTAWDFAPYLLDLKHRIKQHWIPPLAFTALGAIHGYTKINFRIYPDGTMTALTVIEERGHGSLHKASANAIKGAAPFRPLPQNFPEEYLDITFGFYYLLPGDEHEFFEKERR